MDTARLQELLDLRAWDKHFDGATVARGKAYCRAGNVLALNHQSGDDADILLGVVRGNQHVPYRCTLRIRQRDEDLQISSTCTCPMREDCKHVVAVLLTATDTPFAFWPGERPRARKKATPRDAAVAIPTSQHPAAPATPAADVQATHPPSLAEWTRWLQTLDEPHGGHRRSDRVAPAERQFGVLLRGAPDGQPPGLLASLVWMRPSRAKVGGTSGALVDPKPLLFDSHDGPYPAPAEGWPVDVLPALALLLQESRTSVAGQNFIPIHADYQELALEPLLARYPVWYERGSAPLTRGPGLPLRLQWRDQVDGSQRLATDVSSDPPAHVLRGSRLWYVQPETGRYGVVDAAPAWLDALGRMPVAQPRQVPALREQLPRSPLTAALPLPVERGPIEHIDCAPVPVLELRVVNARTGRSAATTALGCARLAFDYGPVRLRHDLRENTVRRLQDGRLFAVHRQRPVELATEGPLHRAGLTAVGWFPEGHGIPPGVVEPGDLLLQPSQYKPALAAREWQDTLQQLQADGFRVEYSADFPRQQLVVVNDWHAEVQEHGSQWFDVSLGIDVGGQRIDLLPLLRRMLGDPAFPLRAPRDEKNDATWRITLDATRCVDMPLARLRALIEPLLEWLQGDGGELRLHRTRADVLTTMGEHAQLPWRGGDLLRAQLDLLHRAERSAKTPRGFKATLRPYQSEGLAWLNFLGDAGLGGILADDMGLGKTVQVLAHIVEEKHRGRLKHPVLVVAPTSLVGNWREETARFAPMLKMLALVGANRADLYPAIDQHDLVITTYPLLPRDEDRLREMRFSLLVLDEAQAIKNPHSQAAQVVRALPATRRLAMTGTPLENHLGELWAQFDAVEPGLLGSERQFNKRYRTPIEKHADGDCQQRLNQRISALLLRRRKQDVLTDLPPKTEIVQTLELEDAQRGLYETLRLAQHERVRQAVAERGLAQSGIIVLDALLKLRQACCDPRLVKLPSARKIKQSAKLEALLELLDSLLAEDRRILLFSQFTEMLALIEGALEGRKIPYQSLTGQTPARERSALVKRFQKGEVPVFLISLKAGGVGLNLTAADTVIHYDPWWNPAVEAQATDRAHRIGQDKPVFVYRLICKGTVEEKIQALQARKADLARAVLEGGGATQRLRFDEADLTELFAPL